MTWPSLETNLTTARNFNSCHFTPPPLTPPHTGFPDPDQEWGGGGYKNWPGNPAPTCQPLNRVQARASTKEFIKYLLIQSEVSYVRVQHICKLTIRPTVIFVYSWVGYKLSNHIFLLYTVYWIPLPTTKVGFLGKTSLHCTSPHEMFPAKLSLTKRPLRNANAKLQAKIFLGLWKSLSYIFTI